MLRGQNMSLYTIDQEYLALLSQEELTEQDIAKVDMLSRSEREKAVVLASYIKNLESEQVGVDMAIEAMQKRSKRLKKKIKDLSEYIISKMMVINTDRISDSPHFEIKLYKNPVKVHIFDENVIPQDYWRRKETVTINLELIKSDILNNGVVIPGADLITDKRLSIK